MNRDAPLAALAYVLVGSLAGFGLAQLVRPAAMPPAPESLTTFDGPESAARLEAILDELRAISTRLGGGADLPRASLPSTPAASPSRRTPAEPATGELDETAQLLERAARLVEGLERRAGGARGQELELAPEGSSRTPLQSFSRVGDASQKFLRGHVLLTPQQVLDRYGQPDEVAASDHNVSWYYEVQHTSGVPVNVAFVFKDGLVVGVYD